jgi:hypothetical protein
MRTLKIKTPSGRNARYLSSAPEALSARTAQTPEGEMAQLAVPEP